MEEFYFYTKGLTVGYHGVPLIKDIELCLKKGEIMTLIGPNGAGKTTILKSIIRQLKPLGGVACLDGSSMEKLTGKELSQKLSVVLTERVRPEMMTCKDVVARPHMATGKRPELRTDRFEPLLILQYPFDIQHLCCACRTLVSCTHNTCISSTQHLCFSYIRSIVYISFLQISSSKSNKIVRH